MNKPTDQEQATLVELAIKLGQKHLAEYGATTSRRDFTQLPVALAVDLKPTHDCVQARSLLAQVAAVSQPQRLYADAGYDAEWIHEHCREQWGVESVIPAVPCQADGTAGGK
jgi:IS5 family transposase